MPLRLDSMAVDCLMIATRHAGRWCEVSIPCRDRQRVGEAARENNVACEVAYRFHDRTRLTTPARTRSYELPVGRARAVEVTVRPKLAGNAGLPDACCPPLQLESPSPLFFCENVDGGNLVCIEVV
jgi:hypothetical protein